MIKGKQNNKRHITIVSFIVLIFLLGTCISPSLLLISKAEISSGAEWEVILNITETDGKDTNVIFGEDTDANDGSPYDLFDTPLPPAPPQPYMRSWFDNGLETPYNYLMYDIRNLGEYTYKTWDLSIKWVAEEQTNITLSWDTEQINESNYDSIVLDYGDSTIDMSQTSTYDFLAENDTEYNFQIIATYNNPPDEPSNPIPADEVIDVGIDTDLEWVCSDDDGDDILYDVYLDTNNPPMILVSDNQDENNYDPDPLLEENKTYFWKINATDDKGKTTEGPIWSFTTIENFIDEEPPTKVTGLSVSDAKDGKLDLSWNAATDNIEVAHYNIYRDGALVDTINHPTVNYQDTGLNNGDSYEYQISANDTSQNEGEKSDPVSGTPTSSDSGEDPGGPGGPGGPVVPPQNQAPTANITVSDTSGFAGTYINFNGSNSYDNDGEIESWEWDFGDGETGTGVSIDHLFFDEGIFDVTLTVTDDDNGQGSDTIQITITKPNNPPEKPKFNGVTYGHKNIAYTYYANTTDLDNDTISYIIDWGDGESVTSEFYPVNTSVAFNHSWTSPGKYTIEVRAFDNQTYSTLKELTIHIDSKDVGTIGYITDDDGDGIYDMFHGNDEIETVLEQDEEGKYLIDTDDDGEWEYIFDAETQELTQIESESKEEEKAEDYTGILILAVIVILILLGVAWYFMKINKKEKKKKK